MIYNIYNKAANITLFSLLILFFMSSCSDEMSIKMQYGDRDQLFKQKYEPIPGPRTCFWRRGPVSKDPYINIAYPDAGVFYWNAAFTVPEGAKLYLEGEFPHARYMSLISYDGRGAPIESLADYLIIPNHNSTNPFIDGSKRKNRNRSYKVEIVNLPPEIRRKEGTRIDLKSDIKDSNIDENNRNSNSLNAAQYGNGQQSIVYRIYVPDKNRNESGGVPLPEVVLVLNNGEELRGEKACDALRSNQAPQISIDAIGLPMTVYSKLLKQPGKPDTWPATVPPTWYLQYDREFLLGIYNGQLPKSFRKSTGGFYPNLDNNYVRTIINRKHGKVFVLKGKLPNTPKTFHGDEFMSKGDMVYWSICSNQGFANTRVNDCLFDEQVPVNNKGEYTIVISRVEDRPRNAFPECGIGWLPMADDGDGAIDEDVTVIQIRNMLSSPEFKHAIQNVSDIGKEKDIMGPYLPFSFYTTTGAFEVLFPCMN